MTSSKLFLKVQTIQDMGMMECMIQANVDLIFNATYIQLYFDSFTEIHLINYQLHIFKLDNLRSFVTCNILSNPLP